ncbi:MAG: hypothetical protein ACREAM_27770 [Blastocatellia bacterium]
MFLNADLKSFFVFAVIVVCSASTSPEAYAQGSSGVSAQEDPNAQYILIQSGELAAQTREIEIPVEVGVWKLQFNLQFAGDVNWTVITPSDRPLPLDMPNLSITNTKERRSILLWDPRPGRWKIRLSGSGRFTTSVTAQGELHVCCIQFFGRNGVHSMDRFQPVRGARQQAQIYASGYNNETIEFRLISDRSELIAPVKFRQSDYSNPHNFTLLVDTPDQPFRVLARGRDTSGKSFQRVIGWLIRPQISDQSNSKTEGARTEGAQAEGGNQAQAWATPQEWNQSVVEGEYKVVRAQIVSWKDEPLLSEKGNPIGIRLKYSIRFPVDGSYSPLPSVYPERPSYGFTGALGMRVHKGSVEPEPDGAQKSNQWVFGGRGIFKTGVAYNFTVDLIPNYAAFNEQKGAFCLQTKTYIQSGAPGGQPGLRERFEREVMSETKIRYRLSISGADPDGRQPLLTERTYTPNAWYQSYRREGAGDCQ